MDVELTSEDPEKIVNIEYMPKTTPPPSATPEPTTEVIQTPDSNNGGSHIPTTDGGTKPIDRAICDRDTSTITWTETDSHTIWILQSFTESDSDGLRHECVICCFCCKDSSESRTDRNTGAEQSI